MIISIGSSFACDCHALPWPEGIRLEKAVATRPLYDNHDAKVFGHTQA
jgi:hypothetical protein